MPNRTHEPHKAPSAGSTTSHGDVKKPDMKAAPKDMHKNMSKDGHHNETTSKGKSK